MKSYTAVLTSAGRVRFTCRTCGQRFHINTHTMVCGCKEARR